MPKSVIYRSLIIGTKSSLVNTFLWICDYRNKKSPCCDFSGEDGSIYPICPCQFLSYLFAHLQKQVLPTRRNKIQHGIGIIKIGGYSVRFWQTISVIRFDQGFIWKQERVLPAQFPIPLRFFRRNHLIRGTTCNIKAKKNSRPQFFILVAGSVLILFLLYRVADLLLSLLTGVKEF